MKKLYRLIAVMLLVTMMSTSVGSVPVLADFPDYEGKELTFENLIYSKNFSLQVEDKKILKSRQDESSNTRDYKWYSSNPSVATVNKNGKVTALKPGKTIITLVYLDEYNYERDTVTINVIKKISYKTIAKKLKNYAKKHKSMSFDNITNGRKCRLYDSGTWGSYERISSRGFAFLGLYRPYIELTKSNNGNAHINLVMYGYVEEISMEYVDLKPVYLCLTTSNKKLSYDLEKISASKNNKSTISKGKSKSKALMSSDKNIFQKKLDTYKTMLKHNSFKVKFSFYNDCKCQYIYVQKVEYKNVQHSNFNPLIVTLKRPVFL